jgi:hypothetical protein
MQGNPVQANHLQAMRAELTRRGYRFCDDLREPLDDLEDIKNWVEKPQQREVQDDGDVAQLELQGLGASSSDHPLQGIGEFSL